MEGREQTTDRGAWSVQRLRRAVPTGQKADGRRPWGVDRGPWAVGCGLWAVSRGAWAMGSVGRGQPDDSARHGIPWLACNDGIVNVYTE